MNAFLQQNKEILSVSFSLAYACGVGGAEEVFACTSCSTVSMPQCIAEVPSVMPSLASAGPIEVVLVFTRRADLETAVYYESGGWDTTGGDILEGVTHWMKLPEPPSIKAVGHQIFVPPYYWHAFLKPQ